MSWSKDYFLILKAKTHLDNLTEKNVGKKAAIQKFNHVSQSDISFITNKNSKITLKNKSRKLYCEKATISVKFQHINLS